MNTRQTAVLSSGFFAGNGLHAIVDGQYGSTGKGLMASFLAELFDGYPVGAVTSNAGPNSGHTFYWKGQKIVLRQLPSFGVYQSLETGGKSAPIYMNAGAIIDPEVLIEEVAKYLHPDTVVYLHPLAAVVDNAAVEEEKNLVSDVGSTGKGTGAALAAKVMRGPKATIGSVAQNFTWPKNVRIERRTPDAASDKVVMEVSQGFSLGLNAGFYPYCTSRDCTVGAAMSDAQIHPRLYRSCAMVVRTFPIRVAGNSGPCYPDQQELSWEELGQTPEKTTVTNKVRRVFNWSTMQFMDACAANKPDLVMVNFMNYLDPDKVCHDTWLKENVIRPYISVMGMKPTLLLGFGPENKDVLVHEVTR